jgi:site-specific recombinase XerD
METSLIASLIERFVSYLESQDKSQYTIVAYKKDLEQFVGYLSSVEITDVRDVNKSVIEVFIQRLLTQNYTKKSASRKLNSIRTFFRYLKKEALIEQNPALDVSHPKYSQTAPRIFSKLEYRAIRDAAKDDSRTYAMIEILLQTGVRIGELTNIRISDVGEDTLTIRAAGKGEGRTVPLNKAVRKAIQEYLTARSAGDGEDYLFITRTSRPLLIRNIRQIISGCFREVGIENATINDFRNTFISHQLALGHPIDYIARVVGHRRLSSTERFLLPTTPPSSKKEQLEEL